MGKTTPTEVIDVERIITDYNLYMVALWRVQQAYQIKGGVRKMTETEIEMRKVEHLKAVMDIGFLIGQGKPAEEILTIKKEGERQ